MLTYLGGLVLGLGLIIPIGPQNIFVFGQSIAIGLPRAFFAVAAAAACDSLLILFGSAGAAVLVAIPGVRAAMLGVGSVFLAVLGFRALRTGAADSVIDQSTGVSVSGVVTKTISVSLLNPHAILDTVGVIGTAIAAQQRVNQIPFATGTITASWLWFLVLASGAALARRFLTPARLVWFDRISGAILSIFAVVFCVEFIRVIS